MSVQVYPRSYALVMSMENITQVQTTPASSVRGTETLCMHALLALLDCLHESIIKQGWIQMYLSACMHVLLCFTVCV